MESTQIFASEWPAWMLSPSCWNYLPMGYQYPGSFGTVHTVWNGQCGPLVSDHPSLVTASASELKHEEASPDSIGSHLRLLGSQLSREGQKESSIIGVKIEENLKGDKQETPTKEESLHQSTFCSDVKCQEGVQDELTILKKHQKKILQQNPRYIPLLEALDSPVSDVPFLSVIECCKQQLQKEMMQDYPEHSPEEQMEASRKNVTQSYIQVLRFGLKLMATEGKHFLCIDGVRQTLANKLATIETVIGIYRQPSFKPYVEFMKQKILSEQHLPPLVMALDIRPSDKMAMMMMMPGFLYALHHPHETYGSWDLETHIAAGNTLHIVQAIRNHGISYLEVMSMLEATYRDVSTGLIDSKYNNISGRYRTIVKRVLGELSKTKRIDKVESARLDDIIKQGGKASSIECIRSILMQPVVRDYLQREFINNGRLMMQIVGDGSLKCHTKLTMMRCYPAFVRAVEQPEEFLSWRL